MTEVTADEATLRIIHCPECGGRFSARPDVVESIADDVGVLCLCGACSSAFTVTGDRLRPSEPGGDEMAAVVESADVVASGASEGEGGRVIVGLEIPSAQRAVADVLRQKGFAPACVSNGELVVAACDPVMPERPTAVVLDVAIPGVLAFEAIAAIRAFEGGDKIPIVLLASVYERTRYKRRPNRLYGADAYLELHHVPDQLSGLIDALVNDRAPSGSRHQTPSDRAKTAPLRDAAAPGAQGDQARVMARRLVSDVALYHGDEIAAGLAAGEPLQNVLEAVAEAREHFVRTTGADGEVFDEMVDAFIGQLLNRNVAHEDAGKSAAQGAPTST